MWADSRENDGMARPQAWGHLETAMIVICLMNEYLCEVNHIGTLRAPVMIWRRLEQDPLVKECINEYFMGWVRGERDMAQPHIIATRISRLPLVYNCAYGWHVASSMCGFGHMEQRFSALIHVKTRHVQTRKLGESGSTLFLGCLIHVRLWHIPSAISMQL